MKVLIWIFTSMMMSSPAFAAELWSFAETPKSTGMGGVRILTKDASDANAFFWNPAALGRMEGVRFTMFNLGAGVNGLTNAQALRDIGNASGLAALDPLYGLPVWVGGVGYTAIAIPYFGFGVFDEGVVKFLLHNPAFPELQMSYINDYGYILGGGLDFGGFSIGANVKRITRTGGPITLGADLLSSISGSTLQNYFTNEGVGYGFDLGLMYTAPAPLSPTISLSWLDVGKTNFLPSKGTTPVPMRDDNLTLGLNVSTQALLGGFSAGLEYRHISNANEQLGKKIHIGTEISLPLVDLRAGLYQGYYTYGVGVDLFMFQLDASLFTVETGAYPGQTPDQRFLIGLSTSLSFDPNFNLVDTTEGGKRRKLKQRR